MKSLMTGNLNSNDIDNDECNINSADSDYRDLINRLNEIKSTIASIEKTIFK